LWAFGRGCVLKCIRVWADGQSCSRLNNTRRAFYKKKRGKIVKCVMCEKASTVGTHKHRHPLFSFSCPHTLKHAMFSGKKPCSQGAGGWRCLCVHAVRGHWSGFCCVLFGAT
jgi:hypothetical protein